MNLPNFHGSAAVLGRHGVFVIGPSGSGKSTLVAQLVGAQNASDIFARWVADDQVFMERQQNSFIMHAPKTIAGKAELAFLGIVDTPCLKAARLDLVVELVSTGELQRHPEEDLKCQEFDVPKLQIPRLQAHTNVNLVLERLKTL